MCICVNVSTHQCQDKLAQEVKVLWCHSCLVEVDLQLTSLRSPCKLS